MMRAPMMNKCAYLQGMMLAVVIVLLTGCGQDGSPISGSSLTAPALDSQAAMQFTEGGGGGGGDPTAGAEPVGGGTPAAASGINAPVTGDVVETSALVGTHGATLTAGRFTYYILPNSLGQPTMVTLRDLTGVNGRVECEILPANLLQSKNAHLTAYFSDLMPTAGCDMFEVRNSGSPSETWIFKGGSQAGGGIKLNVKYAGHFSPGTSQ
ncbi:MAG: hypothetical protein FD129_160 [bacterium]|nr:MAG: hypothetical protein FD129_160 [bacterium]